jgi:N-acetylglucosamine malate deacetylase 1
MKTILAIGAHPDDIEIGCAGALALLQKGGARIFHTVVTNGEQGSLDIDPQELVFMRKAEARDSGRLLGAEDVFFLNLPDGATAYGISEKINLIRMIRDLRPDAVFTHSASDHFPDHALTHRLTMEAIEGAKGPWYSEARGEPHKVSTVLGYEVWNPMSRYQSAIDISEVIETKILALSQHRSQTTGVNYLDAVRSLARYRGAMTMAGTYAEVFEVLRADRII